MVWSAGYIQSFSIALNLANNKNKINKTSEHWSRDMLNFRFLEKDLGIVSLPQKPFWENCFSYYTLLTGQI